MPDATLIRTCMLLVVSTICTLDARAETAGSSAETALATMQTLQEGRIRNNINLVEDGVEAINFLRREQPYHDAPRPDLILLDLQLPRKNGREVLGEIKSDPRLKRIPVVIMTGTSSEQRALGEERLAVQGFLTKPVDLDKFLTLVARLKEYWKADMILPSSLAAC